MRYVLVNIYLLLGLGHPNKVSRQTKNFQHTWEGPMSQQIFAKRYMAIVLMGLLAAMAVVVSAAPARAADVTTGGVTYELIDDADPSAGAIAVAYDGTANNHPRVSVFGQVQIEGQWVTVVSIDDEVFHGAGVTSATIPASVTSMGDNVFGDNPELDSVFFQGSAPAVTGNPIATDAATDPEVRVLVEYLSGFEAAPWDSLNIVPVALVSWADPILEVSMPFSGLYVQLVHGAPDSLHGFIPEGYVDIAFDIDVPEGYVLAGWLGNGQPWEIGDPITEHTVLTPQWTDITAVRSMVITASATTVNEGGSVTFSAEGFNVLGDSVGDVTADVEFSSDVATDQVDGATITFPTASPHTINALHLPTEVRAEPVVIEVVPAAIDDEDDVPVVPDSPAEPDIPAAPVVAAAPPVAELAETGWAENGGLLAIAAVLSAAGGLLTARHRRLSAGF